MKETLKNYIENLYKDAKLYGRTEEEIKRYCGQAFGALMFAQKAGIIDYHEGCDYWNLEMRHKFEELWLSKRKEIEKEG